MASNDQPGANDNIQKVWYCLVVFNGKAYKMAPATKAWIAPGDVDDLKVKIKADCPNALTGMDAHALDVYRNKASLDKHTQALADKNMPDEQPLQSWHTLEYLGMTGPEALMVVLPDALEQALPCDGTFLECSNQFFSDLLEINEVNGWLKCSTAETKVPCTTSDKFYVRPAYKIIADAVLAEKIPNVLSYVLISGTPGIGKSVFLNYFIWRLVKEKQRMLLLTTPMRYFDGKQMMDCETMPSPSNNNFWTPDLWCLVDARDPTTIPGFPHSDCSILLSSAPRNDCIKAFHKLSPSPVPFFMPRWTEEELDKIAHLFPPAKDKWRDRFEHLGGVPRSVLQNIDFKPMAILEDA